MEYCPKRIRYMISGFYIVGVCSAEQVCRVTQAELDANYHLESINCPITGEDISLNTVGYSARDCQLQCATGYYHKDYSEENPLTLTCEVQNDSEEFGKTNLAPDTACYRAFVLFFPMFLWHIPSF